jgi:putative addiction module component (TIGR02574 family)
MIYAMMQAYEQEKEQEIHLSPKQWNEIERRSKEMKSGKAKTISHEELMRNVKAKLRAAKK